jgi:cytochrome P450
MPMTATATAPGPKPSLFDAFSYRPGRDPLAFFTNLARTYGDVVAYRLGGERLIFVNDPQHIKDILVTNNRNFTKGRALQRTKRLLGEGLLTSEGAMHLRQRRLMQPAFHRERIAAYAGTMVAYADRTRRAWRDGVTLDVAKEMNQLTLSIVGKTLFDADVESQAVEVGVALTGIMETFWTTLLPFSDLLEHLPVPKLRRARAARAELDAIIYRMIAERRRSGRDHGDLLSMLLSAQDEEAEGAAGPPSPGTTQSGSGAAGLMSDVQVRDEAMTIFLAGHETTANALTWTWYLLSTAPAVEARLHEEVDRALQGRLPRVADIASLPFVERVVTESMRLYPPAWLIGRRAIADYQLGAFAVPARTILVMSPFVTQRDGRFYKDPERFDPDRWTPDFRATLPKFAYFPFGGGPRQCIGESFAWMELILLVATIAQQWRLQLVPGHPVVPEPLVTLRTKHGMRMTAHRRDP